MEQHHDPQPDSNADNSPSLSDELLSIKQATQKLYDSGLPRNERSVRRYCKNGELTCELTENAQHQQEWRVSSQSINLYIQQQVDLGRGHERTRPDVSEGGQQSNKDELNPDMNGHVQARPDVSENEQKRGADPDGHGSRGQPPTVSEGGRYVHQLERENELLREQLKVKDQQISASNDRAQETNILIKGLQDRLPILDRPRQPRDLDA